MRLRRRGTSLLQPCWGRLFGVCLIALLLLDRQAPVVLSAGPVTASDGVRSLSYHPEVLSGDRWSGVSDSIRHFPGVRRAFGGDIALAPGALALPQLPPIFVHFASIRRVHDVTYQHERFYIHPRAPTGTAHRTT